MGFDIDGEVFAVSGKISGKISRGASPGFMCTSINTRFERCLGALCACGNSGQCADICGRDACATRKGIRRLETLLQTLLECVPVSTPIQRWIV